MEYLIPKKTNLRFRMPAADEGLIGFVSDLLQVDPAKRLSAEEALKHPWLAHDYGPIS